MKINRHGKVILFLVMGVFVLAYGCAGENKGGIRESDYKRMFELQKQKAAFNAEEPAKKLPDMTVDDFERSGDNYIRQGNLVMAFVHYNKALQLKPDAGLRQKVGRLLLKKGMTDEAMKEFRAILKSSPDSALAYEGMGRAFLARGELDQATESLGQAVKLDEKLWQPHALLGIIYDRQKRFGDAIQEYRKAVAIYPHSSILYNNLGMSLHLKGEYEKAVDAYVKAAKTEPANLAIIYNNLGLALCKLKRYDEAFDAFRNGGDEASAHNNLGYVFMSEQKYQAALDSFEKALETRPKYYVKARENMQKAKTALKSQTP